jgi:hypothetical protein
MKVFTINENLKDKLVSDYKAFKAITIHYPKGLPFMRDRFFETMVYWDKKVSDEIIDNALQEIYKISKKIKKYCYFEGPEIQEFSTGPGIIWALFDKKEVDKDYLTPS